MIYSGREGSIPMSKKPVPVTNTDFFEEVAGAIESAKAFVGRTIDLTMCITYFEVGRMIVEKE